MYIKDIMIRDVTTVKADDTVEKCANLLMTKHLSGLPVVDDKGKVIGIVTEGDLIRRAARIKEPPVLEVLGGIFYPETPKKFMEYLQKTMGNLTSDVMTESVITVSPDKEIEDAATLLVKNKIKRLPVVDENKNFMGIVSRKDIMNYLFDKE